MNLMDLLRKMGGWGCELLYHFLVWGLREDIRDCNGLMISKNRHIFDLKEKLPYHSLDEKERGEIWDDGLHFSKKGYERLGEMVGECLVGILKIE
jgi:lysophospholipase L1-like esterase